MDPERDGEPLEPEGVTDKSKPDKEPKDSTADKTDSEGSEDKQKEFLEFVLSNYI